MDAANHPDEVDRLRSALWGDERLRDDPAALHARDCDACGGDVLFHRKVRDAMRRLAAASTSEAAVGHALRTARAALEPADADWIPAVPVAGLAGVRSGANADIHFVAESAWQFLDVLLHAAGAVGNFAVSGQVSNAAGSPAAHLDVTLFVDRLPVAGATTDGFGEFSFATFAGARWGLRLGAGATTSFIEMLPGAGAA